MIKFSTEKKSSPSPVGAFPVLLVVIIAAVAILVLNCFAIVNEGYVGVKYQLGRIVAADLKPGLNFKIPFIETVEQVEVRDLIYEITSDAYTQDTQLVNELRLKLTYRYRRDELSNLIQGVGISNVENRYLVPNVQKIAKDAIGRVRAEQLVQSRGQVQDEIRDRLVEELEPLGIEVTAFAIENIAFEKEFEASIQNKVVAEQKALEAINVTKQREEEKKQAIIAAEGRAESVLLEAEAEASAIALIQEQISQSRQYIEYLKIVNWNGVLPQVIGDGVNPFVVLGGESSPSDNE
ncbi:MAG: prohibitin family protein [Oscillospiraceae bacterium]|nr:prohibitin family protein [Oscillospiraceae bacterium]